MSSWGRLLTGGFRSWPPVNPLVLSRARVSRRPVSSRKAPNNQRSRPARSPRNLRWGGVGDPPSSASSRHPGLSQPSPNTLPTPFIVSPRPVPAAALRKIEYHDLYSLNLPDCEPVR